MQEIQERSQSLGPEDPLAEGVAAHFSFLVWRIPRAEEREDYIPKSRKESDTTERLRIHTHTYTNIYIYKDCHRKTHWKLTMIAR